MPPRTIRDRRAGELARTRALAEQALAGVDVLTDTVEAERQWRQWSDEELDEALDRIENLEVVVAKQVMEWNKEVTDALATIYQVLAALPKGERPKHEPVPGRPLNTLRMCIEQGYRMRFTYTKQDGVIEERIVSPYELAETSQGLRLSGWDHKRDGMRQFAPERMTVLQWQSAGYRPPEGT
jgi:predicted DNA-binding transcriptional regulator YafY